MNIRSLSARSAKVTTVLPHSLEEETMRTPRVSPRIRFRLENQEVIKIRSRLQQMGKTGWSSVLLADITPTSDAQGSFHPH